MSTTHNHQISQGDRVSVSIFDGTTEIGTVEQVGQPVNGEATIFVYFDETDETVGFPSYKVRKVQ